MSGTFAPEVSPWIGAPLPSLVAPVVLALALLVYRALRHRAVNAHAAYVEPESAPV